MSYSAKFMEAFKKTQVAEGYMRWSDAVTDRGGETFSGISRRWWPDWEGWPIIDVARHIEAYLGPQLSGNDIEKLKPMVMLHYWDHFWEPMGLERFEGHTAIQRELFDTGVNLGPRQAIRVLQRALNSLNLNERLYDDIKVDGWAGIATMRVFRSLVKQPRGDQLLYKVMNLLQGMRYMDLLERDPTQELNLRSWLNRVDFV